jgi:hypothetical protein
MADSYSPKATKDADEHSCTSSKRSRTRRTVFERLVMDMLPTHGPGMSPTEVTERLKEDSPAHTDGLSPESLKTQVRTVLREMRELEKVSRVPAEGPSAGFSYRYVRRDSAEADRAAAPKKSLIVVLRLPRSETTSDSGRHHEYEDGDEIQVRGPMCSRQQTAQPARAPNSVQQDLVPDDTTSSERPQHLNSSSKLELQHGQAGRAFQSSSQTGTWTDEHKSILQKVTDAKRLVVQLEKTKRKISTLETRQNLARRQRSVLQGQTKERETLKTTLLAKAQALHEKAAELEREAVVFDTDVGRLQREIQDLGGNLAECTADIDVAREDCTRLAEQLRSTVEETVGGDLVDLLSLSTRRTP